ncbi:MAG: hypothetical protein ACK5Z2_19510 [Bacteroidota bacterium]|jgi:hypothetical protein
MFSKLKVTARGTGMPFVLAAALLFSCSGRNSGITFELIRHIPLDESKTLLQYSPQQVFAIGDDRIVALTGASATIYNTYSGKQLRAFTADTVLDNQLLNQCRAADSLRGMVYHKREPFDSTAEGIFSGLSRVQGLYACDDKIYMIYYVALQFHFRSYADYAAVFGKPQDSLTAKANAAARNYPIEDVVIAESRVFLIETDTLFTVKQTSQIEFRSMPKSKHGQYHFLPEMGFAVDNNSVFAMAHNQDALFILPDTMRLYTRDSLTLLAEMKIGKQLSWIGEKLNTAAVKNYVVYAPEHTRQNIHFRNVNDTLLFQSSAGWYSFNGHKYHLQPEYNPGEMQTGDFDYQENCMIYSAKNPAKSIDSMFRFQIVTTNDKAVVKDTLMNGGGVFGKSNNQYFFINSSGEHYFIDVYELKKN